MGLSDVAMQLSGSPVFGMAVFPEIRYNGQRAFGEGMPDDWGGADMKHMRKYKIAAVQMDSGNDKMENLRTAEKYLEEAAGQGARLVCFPEDMNLVGKNRGEGGNGEEIPGVTTELLRRKATEYGIYIHSGSFRKNIPGDSRYYNTSVLISPEGEIFGEYHKIHTFDVTLPDGTVSMESKQIRPGEQIVTVDTELGCLGFAICYDLRFPELFRAMALRGAQVIFVPANFTDATGRDHWEVLLRSRAIENGCYIIAPDQCGRKPAYLAHGNTMVIDPWGTVAARAAQEPGVIFAEVDLDVLSEVRRKIPSLANCRRDIFPGLRAEQRL